MKKNTVNVCNNGIFGKLAIVMIAIVMVFMLNTISAHAATKDEEAVKVFSLINEYRAQHGLKALQWCDQMTDATVVRANEVSKLFSHTRPDGSMWWTANTEYFYGEILGDGYTTAEDMFAAWAAHQTHADIITKPEYSNCNIQIVVDENGHWWWTGELG